MPKKLWPCRAYVVSNWGYALSQAQVLASIYHQRVWVYRATLDDEKLWVFSFDPKKERQ